MFPKILTPAPGVVTRNALLLILSTGLPCAASAQGFTTEKIEGRIHFSLGPTYNRVEGLPLTIGPIMQTRGENPIRLSALVIVRTENNVQSDFDQVGFMIGIEKDFGSHVAVGTSGWSRIKWIEDRGISNLESSLGAVVFHEDRRDYFDAIGIGVHGRFHVLDDRFTGIVGFRHERIRPVAATGVSSIFRNGEIWRDQALAAQGTIHSMRSTLEWDSRPARRDGPFNGWYAELDVLVGLGGVYSYPETNDPLGNPIQNFLNPDNEPIRITADVRRYFALGEIEVNIRTSGGGSVTNRPLPTQYQFALGGSGSLPGLRSFQQDCGARGLTVLPTANGLRGQFSPYYGCDRYVLLQAEVAGYFGFAIGDDNVRRNAFNRHQGFGFRLVPQWVLFADAGQGWSLLDGFFPTVRDEKMRYDAGVGIVFGDVGGYLAYPLNTTNPKVRVSIRLIRRI